MLLCLQASVVTDLQYLQSNGMSITMFGLQNEVCIQIKADFLGLPLWLFCCTQPPVGPSGCTYSCCGYSQQQYYEAFGPVAEAVKAAFPGPRTLVHADSWGGQQASTVIAFTRWQLTDVTNGTFEYSRSRITCAIKPRFPPCCAVQHASLVRDDPKTAALVDAWTWHSIGTNSDTQAC
jgi:hypothetical protein